MYLSLYLASGFQLSRILSFSSICLAKFDINVASVIWCHQNVLPCLPWLEETKRIPEEGTSSRSMSRELACFAQITSVCHSNSALHCDSYKLQKNKNKNDIERKRYGLTISTCVNFIWLYIWQPSADYRLIPRDKL